ncbi:MAG TPA: DUF1906 domain-containing protein [Streptosporangiaceae bacterium]
MAVIVSACVSCAIATGAGTLPAAHAAARAAAPATKVVQYRGYELSVPASWPVYQLGTNSHQCVRYDMHAVYLGMPGAGQDCPPGLVGRTETVSVGGPALQHGPSAIVVQSVPLRGQPAVIMQDARERELGMTLSAPSAPAITATYGADPGVARQVLASIHQMVYQAENRADPELKSVTTDSAASTLGPELGAPLGNAPAPAKGPMAGFDTCTAPSLATMKVWRAKFAAAGIYIGGEEAACDYGNLTPQWVKAVKTLGWSLLPTYVGLQAPCDSFSGKISRKPAQAAAQGKTDAEWAVEDAQNFGLGKGAPIYDDMEAYNSNKPVCVKSVLTFLNAWTRQIEAEGYVSGVYSSAGSGILDLNTTSMINGHPMAEPQALWFALWDNASDLNGSPYLSGALWPLARRSKQYEGSRWVKVRKVGLDVDLDLVNSATVR